MKTIGFFILAIILGMAISIIMAPEYVGQFMDVIRSIQNP